MLINLVLVIIGGGIGAGSRYFISNWMTNRFGSTFPLGTLTVNILGCLLIGLFMGLTTQRLNISPYWRLFATIGFLGGLTTFSSFSYETLRLLQENNLTQAFMNLSLNTGIGLFVTWIGINIAKIF